MKKYFIVGILSVSILMPFLTGAVSVEELQAQIKVLMAQVATLQVQLNTRQSASSTAPWCHTFNTNLGVGRRGLEVAALITALSRDGNDTGTGSSDPAPLFSENVASAVTAFQEKYKDEILTPYGLKKGTGYFGPSTRKKLNQLYGCGGDVMLPPNFTPNPTSKPNPSPIQCSNSCPVYSPPFPGWCSGGQVASPIKDLCGCYGSPQCVMLTPTSTPVSTPATIILNTPAPYPFVSPFVVLTPAPSALPTWSVLPEPQARTEKIPNVYVLNIPSNDPSRHSNGNISMDSLVKRFYQSHNDDFDMIVTFDLGKFGNSYNGWTDGVIRRYVPSNIGLDEICEVNLSSCNQYPDRLRYMQQIGEIFPNSPYVFLHEVGHYWGVGWGEQYANKSCYENWMPYFYDFSNGHWSNNLEAGSKSVLTYGNLMVDANDVNQYTNLGKILDNRDGTFTSSNAQPMFSFNYLDLYSMGLMSREELAIKNMFVVYNLVKKYQDPLALGFNSSQPEWNMYYGTRKSITLDDLQMVLRQKSACENKHFYTGNGSRVLNSYDNGKELAKDFRIALVLVKHPEQIITNQKARQICQAVNYDFPKAWNDATYGLSNIHTYLSSISQNPDCNGLFPVSLD